MKNKEYFKKCLISVLIIINLMLILLIVIDRLEYSQYKKNFNYKLNGIIEKIQQKYSNVTAQEIIEILNDDKPREDTLKEYGYNIEQDSYVEENEKINLIYNGIKITLFILGFTTVLCIFIKYSWKNDKKINDIIKTIENINHKNYELQLDELSEDKLSILKQEIYKTTIMLKENAENSLNDKVNLKNSLEDISHQLKTPLTSINILLDNLIDEPDMDINTREKFIKQIKREVSNITFLVQSILKLSKFESNTIEFIRENTDMIEIINGAVENVSNLCDLKDICIEVNNKCETKINCDLRWQIEAVTNILKNAVEYSEYGNKILVECEENNIYSQIKIKDFGKGMSQEDTLNIFKRFYKGKNSNKDSIGIGLSLSKAIIEADNGRVTVDSIEGKGTTFIIKYFWI